VSATLPVRAAGGDDFIAAARVRARSWRVAYEGLVPRSYLAVLRGRCCTCCCICGGASQPDTEAP